MPVTSKDFCKPSGKPCQHLVEGGCGIYATRPEVCQVWLCIWRRDVWLGARPDYRPDKLGVMFSAFDGAMSVWEVKPGALSDPRVQYIKNRLKHRYPNLGMRVNHYPLGVLEHSPTPDMVGQEKKLPASVQWWPLGNHEYVLVRVPPEFFDRERYLANPPSESACWGCGKPWDQCQPTPALLKKFTDMTRWTWPEGRPMRTYSLRQEFETLGLDTSGVPDELSLCVGCSMSYMRAFNRLLTVRHEKPTR
jgi:hypothetical protein